MVKHIRAFFGGVPIWLVVAAVVVIAAAACLAQQPEPLGPAGARIDQEEEEIPKMSMLELLLKGRWFMVPIGLCSLLGLAVIIERFVALRRGAIIPPGFMAGLKGSFRHTTEDRQAGLSYCHENDCPMARVAAAGIRKLHRDEESVEQTIEDAGANEVAKLRRNLRMLYGVAAVAPMLGLLGTVWGMIQAFQVASVKGLGRAESLATGIYEALVTTFGGLCVAIPVLIFYYYFLGKIEWIVSLMNDESVDFLEHYIGAPAEPTVQT